MADILGDIIGGGAAIIGAGMTNQANYDNQTRANQFNREEAATNRAFQQDSIQKQEAYQTDMSNTAYQRATADMEKAGINPMLAYMKGGASTPSGGSASGGQASAQTPNVADPIAAGLNNVTRMAQLQKMANEVDSGTSNARVANVRAKEAEAALPAAVKASEYDAKWSTTDAIQKRANSWQGMITSAIGALYGNDGPTHRSFKGNLPGTYKSLDDAKKAYDEDRALEDAGSSGIPLSNDDFIK